jgi:hypothetical protein
VLKRLQLHVQLLCLFKIISRAQLVDLALQNLGEGEEKEKKRKGGKKVAHVTPPAARNVVWALHKSLPPWHAPDHRVP